MVSFKIFFLIGFDEWRFCLRDAVNSNLREQVRKLDQTTSNAKLYTTV